MLFGNMEVVMGKWSYVYIITNKLNDALYIGVTGNLAIRIYQHKNRLAKGFTEHFDLDRLVYFERTQHMGEAIARVKQIKSKGEDCTFDMVAKFNPRWLDLYSETVF